MSDRTEEAREWASRYPQGLRQPSSTAEHPVREPNVEPGPCTIRSSQVGTTIIGSREIAVYWQTDPARRVYRIRRDSLT